MTHAYLVDYLRTPFGRYGGALSSLRTDDLAAIPIAGIMARHPHIDWAQIDEVILGCANQAGEDNRNVARMASLLAGLPVSVPGTTINRLCGSGMDAIATASRLIKVGDADLVFAGGVESMSRAPFIMPKAEAAFTRKNEVYDTTIGWRFINDRMTELYGTDSMPETGENVAEDYSISRADQDAFACRSQQRAAAAQQAHRFDGEIIPVTVPGKRGTSTTIKEDEHPRAGTTLETLAKLGTPFRKNGSVTAGNASGVNDGAAALLLASEDAVKKYSLSPIAKISGSATVGVPPRIMGIGPAPACEKLLQRLNLTIANFDVIELNEAFASQALAVMRQLGIPDGAEHVNPNGGAIALGHPLGASGARITGTAALEMQRRQGKRALTAMCIGVGQGIAIALEAV
ncbi:MAG: 3-oxoadipyl-CoA thiolase [Kordiimonadaceae bacterium]|nr:3-oxoadipyl-CoA thiolase [Kordiimonadaceae bacterium]